MAIIKCKMCGGDLNLIEGASTAECEFCGSVQTIPNLDDEKKLIQFERAERLRKQCEFDKAAGIYETIVADFRQEAEAYWGLVLCKYGIEYVDDPATGKKVPTCHRSSFDSIMEDSDFEQALENADGTARKVYRDEAKAIEEIRKGIIAVSNNEKPYDIFICYKETDENGDRTLDSVLAQDVYDALTGKGYRVFFSRITLEDKLGMEYEPYIFAALNSAKIMLAFGTDYEYFNAVWVKNEWSRFLKLMAKDKEKHLIPCFKGIDAYDMPKEFARLQAQDLGKVGAIQDLLRGIEKLLPRQAETTTVIQDRVVVGGSGDNKIASLLDRGNMALEDGDWAKADSFFEDVLNNDSKNAQAYLGKTLAMEKCRTIDAFARKRKDASQNVRGETLKLPPNQAHVDEMAKQFSLPGYVEQSEICKLYDFDLSYHSDVAERRQQYRNEEKFWVDHKWLSKAEKFAVGAVAENLQREKKALFAVLADRVKKAEAAEATEKQNVQTRYEAHLRQADEQAEKLYNEGLARREKYYKELLQIAKTSSDVAELTETAKKFEKLGSYQDSKNLAEHCRKRAAEEQAKLDAEEERQRILRENQAKERKAKAKKITIVATAAVSAVVVFVILLTTLIIPSSKYNNAVALLEAKQYEDAMQILDTILSFKDSEQLYTDAFCAVKAAYREQADKYLSEGDLINASIFYGKAGDHALAESIFDIDTRFAVDEYIIAGIMKDGTLQYLSDNQYDKKDEALKDLQGVVSLVAHTTDGINGLDASGKLLTHKVSAMNEITIYDSMDIEKYSGIRQVEHGIVNEYYVLMLLSNGRVVCAGEEGKQIFPECTEWTNIRHFEDHYRYVLGIDTEGKAHVAYSYNEEGKHRQNVEKWPAVKTVYCGWRDLLVGLTEENTLVISYDGKDTAPRFLTSLTGVVDMYFLTDEDILADDDGYGGEYLIAVLMEDGKVRLYDYNGKLISSPVIDGWREVVKLQTGLNNKMIGITHKGTIECYGAAVADYSEWTDIVAIQNYHDYDGYFFSVGVKADGTVVTTSDGTYTVARAVGSSSYVHDEKKGGTYCNVSSWDLW